MADRIGDGRSPASRRARCSRGSSLLRNVGESRPGDPSVGIDKLTAAATNRLCKCMTILVSRKGLGLRTNASRTPTVRCRSGAIHQACGESDGLTAPDLPERCRSSSNGARYGRSMRLERLEGHGRTRRIRRGRGALSLGSRGPGWASALGSCAADRARLASCRSSRKQRDEARRDPSAAESTQRRAKSTIRAAAPPRYPYTFRTYPHIIAPTSPPLARLPSRNILTAERSRRSSCSGLSR